MSKQNLSPEWQALYRRLEKIVAELGRKKMGAKLVMLSFFIKVAAHAPSEKAALENTSQALDMFE